VSKCRQNRFYVCSKKCMTIINLYIHLVYNSFLNSAKFKYLGQALKSRNSTYGIFESRLNFRHARYPVGSEYMSSLLPFKNLILNIMCRVF
jgi:hypothetical protein